MPYCPKCDMEFVEGMTTCTDCGGPLVESKEAADATKAEMEAKANEELRLRMEQTAALNAESEDMLQDEEKQKKPAEYTQAYVKKEQRYEDMSSSASAFFLVGGILGIGAVLCFAGIINLPMAGFSKYIFQGLMALMAVGCILVAVSSKKRAAVLKEEARDEEKETDEIITWFLKNYTGKELDEQIHMEDHDLSEEELSLKRFELIQDLLITGRDIPDQSYADSLCDTLYARLYDEA